MKWRKVAPIPIKGRARHNSRGVTYTPKETREHLRNVAESWDGEFYEPDTPLSLVILIYKPIPKTTPKSITAIDFTVKPDVDNVLKAVMDGLTGVAFRDDSQIVTVAVSKMKRTRDVEEPYIEYLLAKADGVRIWVQNQTD